MRRFGLIYAAALLALPVRFLRLSAVLPTILRRPLYLILAALSFLASSLPRWRVSCLRRRRSSLKRFFRLVVATLFSALRVSALLISSHFAALRPPLPIAASAGPFLATRLVAWRSWLVRFQPLRVRRWWSLGGVFRPVASLFAPLPIPSWRLIPVPLVVAECLALELSGATFATPLLFRDLLVLRDLARVLAAWLEPLITAVRWRWNIGLGRSIHFTCALANAPSLLANSLVELLISDGCHDPRRPFFAGGPSFNTRRHYAEHIAVNSVSYFTGSDDFAVDIPATFKACPPDRLLAPPLNFSEVGPLVKYEHVVDIRDFRHVHAVVDDCYVLARRDNIWSKPWGTEMPDRTEVVVFRTYAEAYVHRWTKP